MHLVIDIDIDAVDGDQQAEIARILRYWAGAVRQMALTPGLEQALMDSAYRPVGTLHVTS